MGVSGRILLDAGHGAPGNPGNQNVHGEAEQDVMRRLADRVAGALVADGLDVARTRPDTTLVDYDRRLVLAAQADWLVSLHSDARAGQTRGWVDPAAGTWWTGGAAGFAVLWSDEGDPARTEARHHLAQGVARHMAAAGFLPYPGADYGGLYEADPEVAGVFVDRHPPARRIRLLRRPVVPSIIVETHEAHDPDEAARWEEPETVVAFARALAAGITEATRPGVPVDPGIPAAGP